MSVITDFPLPCKDERNVYLVWHLVSRLNCRRWRSLADHLNYSITYLTSSRPVTLRILREFHIVCNRFLVSPVNHSVIIVGEDLYFLLVRWYKYSILLCVMKNCHCLTAANISEARKTRRRNRNISTMVYISARSSLIFI